MACLLLLAVWPCCQGSRGLGVVSTLVWDLLVLLLTAFVVGNDA